MQYTDCQERRAMRLPLINALIPLMTACNNEYNKGIFIVDEIPNHEPIEFKKELAPGDKIIHRGIFSPDFVNYYYTISDKNYTVFDVLVIKKEKGKWSGPQTAFFNSDFSEHGMSFSQDGKTLYFSSTRPSPIAGVPGTWHIWKAEQVDGIWSSPEFVDIPNLRDKLVSHPSVTISGTIYFHVSNLDYSDMDIYRSRQVNGKYENAEKLALPDHLPANKCTPYISPDEEYLLFGAIGKQIDLMIAFNNGKGGWTNIKKLNALVNSDGQGNPHVAPNSNFLFFATGKHLGQWSIKWVCFEPELLND